MTNELSVTSLNVGEQEANGLRVIFQPFLDRAKEMKDKALAIKVESVGQVEEMKQAREARLIVKDIRCTVENNRKSLKEKSLRTGKAIDYMAKFIKDILIPLEDHLSEQENFAKIEKEKAIQELHDKRYMELSEFGVNLGQVNLGEMEGPTFDLLLNNSRIAKESAEKAKVETDQQAQKDAVDASKARELEVENQKLKDKEENRRAKDKAEKDAIEKKKLKELQAPDKEKIIIFIKKLNAVEGPILESEESVRAYKMFIEKMKVNVRELRVFAES